MATAKGETTEIELSRTQQSAARRMAESKATIPDFSVEVEVDMEQCAALRAELGSGAPAAPDATAGAEPPAATYTDVVVKACALALREQPLLNGSYRDGRVQLHSRVNVGVALEGEGTVHVPTVFDADRKPLVEIARELDVLAERVRAGALTPPELGGATFSVSDLGSFGVRAFTAIVNPPQLAAMCVGAVEPRAVARGEQVLVRRSATLRLVCDARALSEADAARFLARVRALLEAPGALAP